MKIPYAARFAALAFLIAALHTSLQLPSGLIPLDPTLTGDLMVRQSWLLELALQWRVGLWLWLVAIFSWMVVLVVLTWNYLPAHRVAGMLQSGLMLIGAVLAIAGINVWMGGLPTLLATSIPDGQLVALVDVLARTLLGSGMMMGGITTAWIAYDLIQSKLLARGWVGLLLASGIGALLAPFFAFNMLVLGVTAFCWFLYCLWLATRRRLPNAFANWEGLSPHHDDESITR